MATKFIRNKTHEFDFDDDKVKVTLRPIRFEDLIMFQALPANEEERVKVTLPFFRQLLKKYVVNLDFKDATGEPITIDDVCEASYLVPLLIEIATTLANEAHPPNPPQSGAI